MGFSGQLTRAASDEDAAFDELRRREFSRLDASGIAYLDYTGAAIPAGSQIRAHEEFVRGALLGNPHSEHEPSRASTDIIERARARLLAFVGADPNEYTAAFTANTSAAIKLVAESFPFRQGSVFAISADNHNSVNGIREFVKRRRGRVETLPLDADLRLDNAVGRLKTFSIGGPSLLGFPAQSNFSGVRHPLALVAQAQSLGFRVLLDAAAFVPTSPIRLRDVKPDFVALSFYKLFGFPTGVGALIARHDALAELKRPWFAGGTVDWASVQHGVHQLRSSIAGFEDGTPNYYGIGALEAGFDVLERADMNAVSRRVARLIRHARAEMTGATHANGAPRFRVYGPADSPDHGSTLAVNLLDAHGAVIAYEHVEQLARAAGIAIRGGCFCNPGASEAAFGFPASTTRRCLTHASRGAFTPRRFGNCLGGGIAVGAIRISVGLPTTIGDVTQGVRGLAASASPTEMAVAS